MPLNPLSLDVTYGVAGRRFQATVQGLTAGSTLEVVADGTPGFSTVNGRVYMDRLPGSYPTATVVLRESKAGETSRESRIDIAVDGITIGAAGVVAGQQAAGISPAQQRLKRAATRAAAFNPEDAPADTADITLTMEATADAALTRIYSAVAGGTALTNVTLDKVARFSGGRYTVAAASSNRIALPVSNVAPAAGGLASPLPDTPGYNAWGWEMEFSTDAPKVQIRIAGNTVRAVRVIVDGRYVSKAALPYQATSSSNYVTLVFATRKSRVIRIEGTGADLIQNVAVAPTASIARSEGPLDRVIALCTGDSYSEGIGAAYPGLFAWTKALGRRMGWSDTRQVAVGQTGYLSNATGTRKPLRQQIADWPIVNSDIAMTDVDVVCIAAGYNDYAQANVLTLLQAEVLATLQAARAMCPNAVIFVFGSHAGARGPDAQTLAVDALIQAAFAQWGDSRSYFVPIASDVSAWTFGTGYVGAANSSGNSDVTISADGTHPSDLGHQIYSVRAASALRAILSQVG